MRHWPHAPVHRLEEPGAYMVTAGTYLKRHLLRDPTQRELVHDALLELAEEFGWQLQAWAVMTNHYHFVALSPDDPKTLRTLIKRLHGGTSRRLNQVDGTPGRKVWFQFWDTELTYQRSYLARLRYVHENPVHHGVARDAEEYRWCSARWFARMASRAFQRTVKSFKIDNLRVMDDF